MNEAEAQLKYEEIKREEDVTKKIESLRPSYNPILSAISTIVTIGLFVGLLQYTDVGAEPKSLAMFLFMYILVSSMALQEMHRRTHKRIDALVASLKLSERKRLSQS